MNTIIRIVRFYTTNGRTGVVYTINGQRAATFLSADNARAMQVAHAQGASVAVELLMCVLGFGAQLAWEVDANCCTVDTLARHINAQKVHEVRAVVAQDPSQDVVDVYFFGQVCLSYTINGQNIRAHSRKLEGDKKYDSVGWRTIHTNWLRAVGASVERRFQADAGYTIETVKGA